MSSTPLTNEEAISTFAVSPSAAPPAQPPPPVEVAASPLEVKPAAANSGTLFSQKLLDFGFITALVLSACCLLMSALYLNNFLANTNESVNNLIDNAATLHQDTFFTAVNARLVIARIALLSCGVFIGMAFGFLGFALFLIGVKEEMSVAARYGNYKLRIVSLAPGVFIILCATILIGMCVTHQTLFSYQYDYSRDESREPPQREAPDLPGPVDTSKP